MSILNSQAVKFEILSDDIKSSEDVFQKLVKVKHCLTGEEGYLLCAHYSKWPVALVSKATWLAGCFTPSYAPTKKLVFGHMPKQTINWKVDEENKTIVLSIRGIESSQNALGQELSTFVYPMQVDSDYDQATTKQISRLKALKRLLFRNDSLVDEFTVIKGIVDYYRRSNPDGNVYDCPIVFYIAQALGLFTHECPMDSDDKYSYYTWNYYIAYQSQEHGYEIHPCEL